MLNILSYGLFLFLFFLNFFLLYCGVKSSLNLNCCTPSLYPGEIIIEGSAQAVQN
jgi:hypothetical protein